MKKSIVKCYQNYVDAKLNNFLHQDASQIAIFNLDDKQVVNCAYRARSKKMFYSSNAPCDCYYDGKSIVVGGVAYPYINNLANHNLSNVLCAVLCVYMLGLDVEKAVKSLQTFVFDNHRMQVVGCKQNVRFVDDSKATNVHAVDCALRSINGDVCLILGGVDKGLDFTQLFESASFDKVRFVACIGQTAKQLQRHCQRYGINCALCQSLQSAVALCYQKALLGGGTVLLSPACSSFDMFESYQQRGDVFQQVVKDIVDA